ncbi:hypothetical protein PAXRUDRAFT_831506 [Paxillus rubicundulus Ve08.2h10]|uniref:Uncharacterized protein n=1 Tax=Paxillus rubicundulus Ve08.2h10 TaxID=930991 RepID=A0A0D0DRW4_9AGAM|nr:hypothetical protein PAXRUDRAFT_831506 [Paxillus rubicundulus Ve08.2h10]
MSDLPAYQIFAEGTWLYGAIVTGVLYGVVVVLYIMCARSIWGRMRAHGIGCNKNLFFFCYVNFLFILGTVYFAFNTWITQLGFINDRNYPGGPSIFEENTSSPPLNTAFVLSNWCADTLMIWRCIVVYRDTKIHFLVTTIGVLMIIASVATGSLWLVIVSRPAQSGNGWMSFSFLFPYISVSLAINIFVSLFTVSRLMYHRARVSRVLGPGHGTIYASFAAMIVESAAVYSISSLLYLIPYAANSPLANSFMQILGESQIIAPLLIIYRVSEGKAWTHGHTRTATLNNSHPMRPMPHPPINLSQQRSEVLNIEVTFETTKHTDLENKRNDAVAIAV